MVWHWRDILKPQAPERDRAPAPRIDPSMVRLALAFEEQRAEETMRYLQGRDKLREAYLDCRRECDRLRKQNREYELLMLKEGVPFPRQEDEGL